MADKALPSPEVLRQLLRYEPETGKLFWLVRSPEWFAGAKFGDNVAARSWNRQYSGKEALTAINGNGYLSGTLLCNRLTAHRVIWALVFGEWPKSSIDHIDHDRTNNRLGNLRAATVADNSRNLTRRSDNSTGVTGVFWNKKSQRWTANIRVDGKLIHLGYFPSVDAAANARAAANIHYGFHPNHGAEKIAVRV